VTYYRSRRQHGTDIKTHERTPRDKNPSDKTLTCRVAKSNCVNYKVKNAGRQSKMRGFVARVGGGGDYVGNSCIGDVLILLATCWCMVVMCHTFSRNGGCVSSSTCCCWAVFTRHRWPPVSGSSQFRSAVSTATAAFLKSGRWHYKWRRVPGGGGVPGDECNSCRGTDP